MNETAAGADLDNLAYVEALYARYLCDEGSVPKAWQTHFHAWHDRADGKVPTGPSFRPRSLFHPGLVPASVCRVTPTDPLQAGMRDRLNQLIRNYRVRGHIVAELDPLGSPRLHPPELELTYYGFRDRDLDTLTGCSTLPYDEPLTLREILERLRATYCRSVGAQFMHIDDLAVRQWLQNRMEASQNRLALSRDEQLRILTRLTDAVVFEEFLRKKFPGAKTFSLEGCETLLPLLDLALEKAGTQGVRTVVMGMGHRGRLNVLANILGKDRREIFREFADLDPESWQGRGDVKHHLGHSGDWATSEGGKIHLSLCFNPSHLEFVNPVVLGRVRAQQDRLGDRQRRRVLGVIIHGDAAFAGEGVVQESLNLSKLAGYSVGGLLHIIINNQLGFTTPPEEGRSTPYATDVARMLQVPIFHVNGEDPEAVAQVVRLAMDFRAEFQTDVFIDMYGYRRWGHNESDEPLYTQPLLYRRIRARLSVRESYLKHLLELDKVSREEAEKLAAERRAKLETELEAARANGRTSGTALGGIWRGYTGGTEPDDVPRTGVEAARLAALLRQLAQLPSGFHLHPKLQRGLTARIAMADGRRPLDWAAAEALALATLASEGVRIRLTGQDTARGTFNQRHAILYDQQDGRAFMPLAHLADDQAHVEIHNSPLCETAALGFEYGYSLDCPDGLVLWEAQFGDFVNAAQVILDQFVSSAEDKWRRLSGLVLLLPHGFEGMGPEHSSARLERLLTLTAEDNIQVVQPTTPAQYFHALRSQALRKWRKPLFILTPKSLLRHPGVTSTLEDCARGRFQHVIPDGSSSGNLRRLLLCSGKVYYELAAYRQAHQRMDVAIVRLEQFYPLRTKHLEHALELYADSTPALWIQEEPANMGAWRYLHERFGKRLLGRFPFALVSRPESGGPATGSAGAHKLEQARLVARAFGDREPDSAAGLAAPQSAPEPRAPKQHNRRACEPRQNRP